jgi:pyrroloquinoline quinone biosynthesis protein E
MSDRIIEAPMGLLLELTHRCPLRCPYCSNPLALERGAGELDTATWLRVLEEAAGLGVLQAHFSGGEPTVRKDLPQLVAAAAGLGLYSNLITSGVFLDQQRVAQLQEAGLDHIQISLQDVEPDDADRIGGYHGGHIRKLEAARLVRQAGLPLTINFVVHRQNAHRVPQMIDLGLDLGADRIEVAHVQYYGWALLNRSALLPTRDQLDMVTHQVEVARRRHKGLLLIDYVVPDYYALRPKACMGGWGKRFINISPTGKALPCHAAETLPGLAFPSVREQSLQAIWHESPAFQRYRGTDWMPDPCRSCERREIDMGGCRCQALALTGDAATADPACALSPGHAVMTRAVVESAATSKPVLIYRRQSQSNWP